MAERPRLTIGLPVYNGAAYLRETLDSLDRQTFTDYELIVTDNCSTDETPDIIAEYAKTNPRIRYVRHPRNLGAHNNYNSLVPLARGEYFKWMAHDDLMEPKFLERCVSALDENPAAILAFTSVDRIDSSGAKIGELVSRSSYDHDSSHERLRAYIGDRVKAPPIFGVIRLETLRETPLLGNFGGADTMLLAELSMRGRFIVIEDHLFQFRFHETRYSAQDESKKRQWYDPDRKAPDFTTLKKLARLVGSVWRVPMSLSERLRCTVFAGYWGLRHGGEMATDIISRARYEVGRVSALRRTKSP